jgi:hypothetical protein
MRKRKVLVWSIFPSKNSEADNNEARSDIKSCKANEKAWTLRLRENWVCFDHSIHTSLVFIIHHRLIYMQKSCENNQGQNSSKHTKGKQSTNIVLQAGQSP